MVCHVAEKLTPAQRVVGIALINSRPARVDNDLIKRSIIFVIERVLGDPGSVR